MNLIDKFQGGEILNTQEILEFPLEDIEKLASVVIVELQNVNKDIREAKNKAKGGEGYTDKALFGSLNRRRDEIILFQRQVHDAKAQKRKEQKAVNSSKQGSYSMASLVSAMVSILDPDTVSRITAKAREIQKSL